jgi:glycosyltransferase involved in cell wall biosynthesis
LRIFKILNVTEIHKIHSTAHSSPAVAILLCTYQGQLYLQAQLDSFVTQTHSNWVLWVSDDGSKDGTYAILNQALKAWGKDKILIHNGPKEGFCVNFLSLTCKADIEADYYAYSDQDDIWQSEKLARALAVLETVPANVPALYCSRTLVVDADDHPICMSPLFTKPPSFANALMQNIGGGNTMVFNDAARKLLIEAGKYVNVVTHDWWAYLLVSGCGGLVFYDAEPTVRYRQHEHNLVGMNASTSARLKRIIQLFKGRFREWTDLNVAAINAMRVHLTPKNQRILDQFVVARQQPLFRRMLALKSSGIYRQTLFGKLGLIVSAIFNKI